MKTTDLNDTLRSLGWTDSAELSTDACVAWVRSFDSGPTLRKIMVPRGSDVVGRRLAKILKAAARVELR